MNAINDFWIWGKKILLNDVNDFSTNQKSTEANPMQFIPREKKEQIKQISSTKSRTIFLYKNGKAIGYLNGTNQFFKETRFPKIKKISFSDSHEGILTEEKIFFAKGRRSRNYHLYDFTNFSEFIEDPNDRIIEDIVSGLDAIYCLTSNGNAYGFGSNYRSQLGITRKKLPELNQPILMMKNVSKIFTGDNSKYVFLLNSNQELFGCGENKYGQLGLGFEKEFIPLTQNKKIPKGKIIDIKTGKVHSVMLIQDYDQNQNPKRKLYSCGHFQVNGLGKKIMHASLFTEIKSSLFEKDNIIEISVGNNHTLILTSKGKLLGFGGNNLGQLGNENMKNVPVPIQIELPKLRFNEDISNYHIYCSGFTSFLYFSFNSSLNEDLLKLFQRKEFCDISFKTENGEIIEAHKLILKYRLNQIEKLQEIISNKINKRIESNI
ncbi:hypothetical protein M0811_08481 [Anaeramoeba ignava]|uniref:Uncharacterized protein n=1 Tax=Anaeramoeba ignava TaxID=1746090 RepID=A0A9Q0RB13_ANAIG|nr:hypothetical protein M0811_08481 [Anaeramoeba ignava]